MPQQAPNKPGLSPQDIEDLRQVRAALAPDDPRRAKIDVLLAPTSPQNDAPAIPTPLQEFVGMVQTAPKKLMVGAGRSAWNMLTAPFEIGKMLMTPPQDSLERHISNLSPPGLGRPALAVKRIVADPSVGEFQASRQAAERNDIPSVIQHAAGTTPLLGPIASHYSTGIAKGEVLETLGEAAVDWLAPWAAAKMIPKKFPPVRSSFQVGGQEIPATTSELTGSATGLRLGRELRETSTKMSKFETNRQTAMGTAIQDKIGKIGSGKPPSQVSQAAQEAAKARIDQVLAEASSKYEPFLQSVKGVTGETKVLKDFSTRLTDALKTAQSKIEPARLEQIRSYLKEIESLPEQVPFEELQARRSNLLDFARDMREGRVKGIAKEFTKLTDVTMEQALNKAGMTNKVQEFRAISGEYKAAINLRDESILAKVLDTPADKVHTLLPKMSVGDLKMLKAEVPQKVFTDIVRNWFDDALKNSQLGAKSGALTGATEIRKNLARGTEVRGGTLRQSIERLGDEKLKELLSASNPDAAAVTQHIKDIYAVSDAMQVLSQGGKLSGNLVMGGKTAMPWKIRLLMQLPLATGISAAYLLNPVATRHLKNFLRATPGSVAETAAISNLLNKGEKSYRYVPETDELVEED